MSDQSNENLTIEEFLKTLEAFVDNAYGRQHRRQFQGIDGRSELAVLQSPSRDEYTQLCRAVAIMTKTEKQNAETLTDEQIQRIAEDADVDKALLAIFINGYALKKQKSKSKYQK